MRVMGIFVRSIAALWIACAAAADDGTFRGAGETLRPLRGHSLRVSREVLRLAPVQRPLCYEILFRREPQPPGADYKRGEFATLGERTGCGEGVWATFSPEWTAETVYEIDALEKVSDVLFAFPVRTWDVGFSAPDGPISLPAPGVMDFKAFFDRQAVHAEKLVWLPGAVEGKKTLGYTWEASFKKGGRHILRTLYAFGAAANDGFLEGRDYLQGEKPWFLKEGVRPGAHRLIYYLTPLKRWTPPPPSKISITVTLPAQIPMTLAVPLAPKPKCIGERSLVYESRAAFPEQEFELSYPDPGLAAKGFKFLQAPQTPEDWEAWMKTLGPAQVEMDCSLLRRLQLESGAALQDILSRKTCRMSCEDPD
jgi:hypothetical protein